MSLGWESLPLLPLRCILSQLSLKDSLAAMSVCQHWRNAMVVFEGHKEHLKLESKQPERNLFVARVFRKHVQRLTVCIEDWTAEELDHLYYCVLPEFYDSVKLKELVFIGPSYLQHNDALPAIKLKRIITESLIVKNAHCITKLALYGCEMDVANDDDRFMHERIEYYSAALSFPAAPTAADRLVSRTNAKLMRYSTLQQISLDYDQLSCEALSTLSQLPALSQINVNIRHKTELAHNPLPWDALANCTNTVHVAVNIIGLPQKRFDEVIQNVLVEGISLVSLKVLFCKTLYTPLLTHVVRQYKSSLRELVWVDAPCDVIDSCHRVVQPQHEEIDSCNINPLILLCWQCVNLRRLVIHGYWIWQYDVLGFVRLRKTLQQLEVSAVYRWQRRFGGARLAARGALRVLASDTPARLAPDLVQQVNEFTEFPWSPVPWGALPPALRPRAAPRHRALYVLKELRHTATEAIALRM